MRWRTLVRGFSAVLLGAYGIVPSAPQEKPSGKIVEAEIKSFINSQAGVDECESLDQIHVDHVEYFDFVGDGKQEAVVVASTCMTGTAGPDVHAVYRRGQGGKLVEMPFLNAKGDPPISNSNRSDEKIPVFGNPNYTLRVENGKLVVRWGDSSDREEPLVVWYKWDGAKFTVDHVKIEGPFPTSYDCSKAVKELDRAICYSPSVAAMDLELGQVYRAALQKRPAEKKKELQNQQREWLAQREKQCSIYKWWVECLTGLYAKRIAELKQQ